MSLPVSRTLRVEPSESENLAELDRFCLFSSRRRHTIYWRDWSSDVCSSDLSTISRGLTGQFDADGIIGDRQHIVELLIGGLMFGMLCHEGSIMNYPLRIIRQAEKLLEDRKSVVQGKSVDLGGRRIIKKITQN